MTMADLKALAEAARAKGWASGSGDIESIRKQAASMGWVEVAPRRGDTTVSVLRPVTESAAHPNSLSAVYGLGQQPLHTDGAHLQVPPDVLVFICERPSATPTQLWRPDVPARRRRPLSTSSALSHGMFLVRNGRDSFYTPALSGSGYRYDPECMTPCDARAREVQEYFEQQLSRASAHEWSAAGQVLVVDNRRALHARSAVAEGDLERELTRIAFRIGADR
jgi:alpha-ketoglutarate-dependent taurine dioxygenase